MDDYLFEQDSYSPYGMGSKERLFDADYVMNPLEHKEVERKIRHIVYDVAIAPKIFNTIQTKIRGAHQYNWNKSVLTAKPAITRDFMSQNLAKVRKTDATVELIGYELGDLLSDVDIMASSTANYHNESILTLDIAEMIAKVNDAKESYLWLGSASTKTKEYPIGAVEGFTNCTGINALTEGDCTAANGIYETVCGGIALLIQDNFKPPVDVVMTKLMWAKAFQYFNATTGKSDAQMIYELVDEKGTKLIRSVSATSNILAATESTANQVCIVIADKDNNGDPVASIVESVPMHVKSHKLIAGIERKVCWKGAPVIYRPTGMAIAGAIALV